jgi:hypothetical protein
LILKYQGLLPNSTKNNLEDQAMLSTPNPIRAMLNLKINNQLLQTLNLKRKILGEVSCFSDGLLIRILKEF